MSKEAMYSMVAFLIVCLFLGLFPLVALSHANSTYGIDVSGITLNTDPIKAVFGVIAGVLGLLFAMFKVRQIIKKG